MWLRIAAEEGNTVAEVAVGTLLSEGDGIQKPDCQPFPRTSGHLGHVKGPPVDVDSLTRN